MKLAARFRWWAIALAAVTGGLAFALRIDAPAYTAPIFDTAKAIMPLAAWSAFWALIAVIAATCAVTMSVRAWRTASLGAVALGTGWWVGLAFGHFVQGDKLSWSGFALWGWFVATNLLMSTSPAQFEPKG